MPDEQPSSTPPTTTPTTTTPTVRADPEPRASAPPSAPAGLPASPDDLPLGDAGGRPRVVRPEPADAASHALEVAGGPDGSHAAVEPATEPVEAGADAGPVTTGPDGSAPPADGRVTTVPQREPFGAAADVGGVGDVADLGGDAPEVATGAGSTRDVATSRMAAPRTLTLELSDPGHGDLRVLVSANRGAVDVAVHAEHRATHDALVGRGEELRRELATSGLRLGSYDVGHDSGGQGEHRGELRRVDRTDRLDAGELGDTAVAPVAHHHSDDHVDVRL
jgi:hypothetical protein